MPVVERALAAVLRVPDASLCFKVAKAAHRNQVDALTGRRSTHLEERLDRIAMQDAARLLDFHDMRCYAAGKLQLVHLNSSRAGVQRSRRRCNRSVTDSPS